MTVIEINNLKYQYSSMQEEFELFIPEFSVEKGEFVSLLGPNGSGKSTLLKIIAGLLPAKQAKINIFDKEIRSYSRIELAKKIAYVPQTTKSVFPFSVAEIVLMGRNPYLNAMGFENNSDIEIVSESLKLMDLYHLRNKGINEISGGEAQRVFIARALAQKAEVILLDEPNAHLDLKHQVQIFELLKELNDHQKITLILVSHDLNLVGVYSQKIVFMNAGNLTVHGAKSEVLTEENIHRIFGINSTIIKNESGNELNVLINPQS